MPLDCGVGHAGKWQQRKHDSAASVARSWEKKKGVCAGSARSHLFLLQQLQDGLSLLVGLLESRDTGLLQNAVFGVICNHRADVRGGDVA